jgi:hypothetical protein
MNGRAWPLFLLVSFILLPLPVNSLSAYYDNRYVDELEKEGFFKKLWQ